MSPIASQSQIAARVGPYVMTEDRGPVAMYYNPAPRVEGGASVQIGGISYPYGTRGVQASNGRWWVAEPENFLKQASTGLHGVALNFEEDAALIVDSINTHLVPWGICRIDPADIREDGWDAYRAKLSKAGQNRLCEIIKTEIIDRLDRENEERVRRDLKPRKFDANEEMYVYLRTKLMESLEKKGALDIEEQKKAIDEAIERPPDATDPLALPWMEFRTWAKNQGVAVLHKNRDQIMAELAKLGKAPAIVDTAVLAEEAE